MPMPKTSPSKTLVIVESPKKATQIASFLGDGALQRDFAELYSYYKDARLLQLIVRDGRQTGMARHHAGAHRRQLP